MIYLDTSAFVKLVWREPESSALWHYLVDRSRHSHVSSVLLAVEARRAALRAGGALLPRVDLALDRVGLIAISEAVIDSASRIPEPSLRSLDALHLATAIMLGADLDVFISYDKRLTATATSSGIAVAAPR